MRLAVAGLSARMMAEAVAREGGSAIALDLFGDHDTRRAATRWQAIGEPSAMQVDDAALLDALRGISLRSEAAGWIAGSGFEARPDLLARGAALLPLVGTRPDAVRRLRDPRAFFPALARLAVPHPETRFERPAAPDGWLMKDGAGTGGWQVVDATRGDGVVADASRYWQREAAGLPMSATFVADGRAARVLGINRLLTRRVGPRPHVFRGVVGPVATDERSARDVHRHADRLARAFGLRGLCSLDFILDGTRVLVLEINARPPASMCLYPMRRTMRAHVRASSGGRLPARRDPPGRVRGFEIVVADHAFTLDDDQATTLARRGNCHDLPAAGTAFAPGDPVCSVSAHGADAGHVIDRLARAVARIASGLDTPS